MNTPIKLGEGSLTMCGIDDFRDTLRKEHTVVTTVPLPSQVEHG